MKRLVSLSALTALSSALFISPVAQACDGHEGKGGPLTRMDANGDGKVTQQEMLATWTARFEAADTNKDGTVTPEEREAAHGAKMREHLTRMDANKNGSIEKDEAKGPLAHFFAEVDTDKNGTLSSTELAAHKKAHGGGRHGHKGGMGKGHDEPKTKAELSAKATEHFKRLDQNADGVLSGDELSKGKHHGQHGHHDDDEDEG